MRPRRSKAATRSGTPASAPVRRKPRTLRNAAASVGEPPSAARILRSASAIPGVVPQTNGARTRRTSAARKRNAASGTNAGGGNLRSRRRAPAASSTAPTSARIRRSASPAATRRANATARGPSPSSSGSSSSGRGGARISSAGRTADRARSRAVSGSRAGLLARKREPAGAQRRLADVAEQIERAPAESSSARTPAPGARGCSARGSRGGSAICGGPALGPDGEVLDEDLREEVGSAARVPAGEAQEPLGLGVVRPQLRRLLQGRSGPSPCCPPAAPGSRCSRRRSTRYSSTSWFCASPLAGLPEELDRALVVALVVGLDGARERGDLVEGALERVRGLGVLRSRLHDGLEVPDGVDVAARRDSPRSPRSRISSRAASLGAAGAGVGAADDFIFSMRTRASLWRGSVSGIFRRTRDRLVDLAGVEEAPGPSGTDRRRAARPARLRGAGRSGGRGGRGAAAAQEPVRPGTDGRRGGRARQRAGRGGRRGCATFGSVARSGTELAAASPSSSGGISSAKDGECGRLDLVPHEVRVGRRRRSAGHRPAPGVESAASIWFR